MRTTIGYGILSLALCGTICWAKPMDAKKSVVKWRGEKVTGHHEGTVALKSGSLDVEKQKGEFVVDMTSIEVTDLSGEYKDKLTAHLKSKDFFDVDSHKTAKLVVKKLVPKGKDAYQASGDLTIKGITKPVELTLKKSGPGYEGALDFDRTKYDIKFRSGSFFKDLGDKLIYDKVKLTFTLVPKA